MEGITELTSVLTLIMVTTKQTKSRADKYSMEDDISCYMCSDQVMFSVFAVKSYSYRNLIKVNLGDDYRVHLDTAHGIKKNFNYFMQQVSLPIS